MADRLNCFVRFKLLCENRSYVLQYLDKYELVLFVSVRNSFLSTISTDRTCSLGLSRNCGQLQFQSRPRCVYRN